MLYPKHKTQLLGRIVVADLHNELFSEVIGQRLWTEPLGFIGRAGDELPVHVLVRHVL